MVNERLPIAVIGLGKLKFNLLVNIVIRILVLLYRKPSSRVIIA